MENIGNSTDIDISSVNQVLTSSFYNPVYDLRTIFNKNCNVGPLRPNFVNMLKTPYTLPKIRKGKNVVTNLKGKKKEQAEAAEKWYVEYYYTDPSTNEKKRFKIWADINNYQTYQEKYEKAEIIRQAHTELLLSGFNPIKDKLNETLRRQTLSIAMPEAIDSYLANATQLGLRKKSIQTYSSKLLYLKRYFTDAKVDEIDSTQLQSFLLETASNQQWSPKTTNATRQIIYALFRFLVKQKYVEVNPVENIDRLRIRESSHSHKPISPSDLPKILKWLDENDPFTCLFVKAIYYTCVRPKELRQIKIGMVNLSNKTLTVPGTISKNGKTEKISLDTSFIDELKELEIEKFEANDYLFSMSSYICGPKAVGENTPYNRFMKCLKILKLDGKGYSLYGIKHTSNIIRYTSGEWTLSDLMVANRHSSIGQTETYLRDLNLQVDLSQKTVPPLIY